MSAAVHSKILKLLEEAESVHVEDRRDPGRFFYMRPSGFPYCGLRKLMEAHQTLTAEEGRLNTLASEYFTSVGTAAHSAFQKFMGRMGTIVGDYKCPVCKDVKAFSTFSRCKKCKVDRQYDELELAYKNMVVGHTDGLFRLEPEKGEDSVHYVIDYKTSAYYKTKDKKKAKVMFPLRSNVAQIKMYVVLLEACFNIKVDGYILVYLGRDLPLGKNGQHVVTVKMSEKEKRTCRKRLDRWVKVHRKVLRAKTPEQVAVVRKYKLCSSMADYKENWHDEYNGCSISPYCFDDKKLTKLITERLAKYPIFPIIDHAPPHIRKVLETKIE